MGCRAPALLPALAVLGALVVWPPVLDGALWPAAVLGLGLALGSFSHGWVTVLARSAVVVLWVLASLNGGPDPREELAGLVGDRPVEVVGKPVDGWKRTSFGWRTRLEGVRVARSGGEEIMAPPLSVYVPGEVEPPRGALLRCSGYLSQRQELSNGEAPTSGPDFRISVPSRRLVRTVGGDRASGRSFDISRLRDTIDRRLDRRRGRAAAMVRALLLGDTSELPAETLAALRRVGLGHLVAVSGLHIGLVAGVVWVLAFAIPLRLRLIVALLAVGLYCMVVGPRPSVARATGMAGIAAVSLGIERRPHPLNAWALMIGAMAILQPLLIDDLGFQLTASATLGLICLAPRLRRRWKGVLGDRLSLVVAASVAAHLFTLPWSVARFHVWAPASVLLNLLAVPWTGIVLPLAGLGVLLESVPRLGDALWSLVARATAPFGWPAMIAPGLPWSLPCDLPFALVALAAGVVALALARATVAVGLATVLLLVALLVAPTGWGDSEGVELVVFDVGQGESILLRDGARALLVDGGGWHGPGVARSVLVPSLLALGIRRLEGIVMSHPDRDHCRGLLEIAGSIPVGRLWTAPGWRDECYRRLVRQPGLRLSPLWRGRELELGRWQLRVLHPGPGDRQAGNERSLVMLARTSDVAVLLTGDVGAPVERRLARDFGGPAATLLKVGHHGSRNSSSEDFLDAVDPAVALVSAGKGNVYGHPAPPVLDRFERRGVQIWRTDVGGQIRVGIDEHGRIEVRQPWADPPRRSWVVP